MCTGINPDNRHEKILRILFGNTYAHNRCRIISGSERSCQGNEDLESVQDSYSCICVWCESGKLGRRGSSRFPCVIPVVETSDRVQTLEFVKHQRWSSSAKTANGLNT